MNANAKRISGLVFVLSCAALIAGCSELAYGPPQPAPPVPVAPQPRADYIADNSIRGDASTSGPSAVQSALEWSEKYAKVAEELVRTQQARAELEQQSRELLAKNARLTAELEQATRELTDANTMLVEMRGELEKWKNNVLGFRQEMLDAQQTQLEATRRVLELLGGQVSDSVLSSAATKAAAANAEKKVNAN